MFSLCVLALSQVQVAEHFVGTLGCGTLGDVALGGVQVALLKGQQSHVGTGFHQVGVHLLGFFNPLTGLVVVAFLVGQRSEVVVGACVVLVGILGSSGLVVVEGSGVEQFLDREL